MTQLTTIVDPAKTEIAYDRRGRYLDKVKRAYAHAGIMDYYMQVNLNDQKIGACELKGWRDAQEDRVSIERLTEFQNLPLAQRGTVIKNAFQELQTIIKTKNDRVKSGSCVISVIPERISDNRYRVWTINIGDSEAFLIRVKADHTTSMTRLNSTLHNFDESSECERLKAHQDKTGRGSLKVSKFKDGYTRTQLLHTKGYSRIAVSRALGDEDYDSEGLSHEPDIYSQEIHLEPGEKAFILLACDGLREWVLPNHRPALFENEIQRIVASTDLVEKKAKALAEKAWANGSHDNISVILAPLTNIETSCYSVFDGHGSGDVADFLRRFYIAVLKIHITQQIDLNQKQSIYHSSAFSHGFFASPVHPLFAQSGVFAESHQAAVGAEVRLVR